MRRRRLLATAAVVVGLLCSGFSYRGDFSKIKLTVTEDYTDSASTNGSFYLNGKYIQLPCKASLLTDLGFEPDPRFDVLKAGSTDYSSKITDDQGRYLYLIVMNNTSEDQNVEDCNVYEVEYNADDGRDYEILDFEINGIKVGDSVDKAMSVMGVPSYTSEYRGVVDAQWDTPKKDFTTHMEYIDTIRSMCIAADRPAVEYKYAYDSGFGNEKRMPEVTTVQSYAVLAIIPIVFVAVIVIGSIAGAILVIRKQKHEHDMEILNTPIDEEDDD